MKISQLPVAATISPTDQLEVNQGGTTRSATVDLLLDAAGGGGGAPSGPAGGALSGTYPNPGLAVAYPTTLPPNGAAGGALSGTYPNPGLAVAYPTTLPPSGAASGDLTGTYPSPTVKSNVNLPGAPTTTTATAGTNTTQVATTAFVSAAVSAAVGGSTPTGPAGGGLSGTYPNPLIKPSVTNGQVLTTVGGVSTWAAPSAGGTVTSVSVVSANGLAGTVATATATPAITLSTSITGLLKGNGTAISAAAAGTDYIAGGGAAGGDLTATYPNPTIKASVSLAGNPTTTTQTVGTNNTMVATTAFVAGAVTAGVTAPGLQLQMVSTLTGTMATGGQVMPIDNTIPQKAETMEVMSLAITPKSATSRLIIEVVCMYASSVNNTCGVCLFKDGSTNALATSFQFAPADSAINAKFTHVITSGGTSAQTFRVGIGQTNSSTTTFNGVAAAALFGGTLASSIVIREVAA